MNRHPLIQFCILVIFLVGCKAQKTPQDYTDLNKGELSAAFVLQKLEEGHVNIQNKIIKGDLQLYVGNKQSQSYSKKVKYSILFKNCVFEGSIIAFSTQGENNVYLEFDNDITFIDCQFIGSVQAKESTWNGSVLFKKCLFKNTASFEGASFRGKQLGFIECHFAKEARFQRLVCASYVNLMSTEFLEVCSFAKSNFQDVFLAGAVKFYRYADFSGCVSENSFIFNYSEFLGQAVFTDSHFRGQTEFFKTLFKKPVFLDNCLFVGSTKFLGGQYQDSLVLRSSRFVWAQPDFESAQISDKSKFTSIGSKVLESKSLSF